MPVQVITGPPHDCARDGHLISLRLRYEPDGPDVRITPHCELCHLIMLPPAHMVGREADWLMKIVNEATWAKEATPEMYEGMFD